MCTFLCSPFAVYFVLPPYAIAGQLETKDRGWQDAIDDNPISSRVNMLTMLCRPVGSISMQRWKIKLVGRCVMEQWNAGSTRRAWLRRIFRHLELLRRAAREIVFGGSAGASGDCLVGWLSDPLRVINSDRIPSMKFLGTAVRVRKEYANGMRLLGRGVRYHSLNNKRRKMTRTMACSSNANGHGVLLDHMYISFMP